MGKELKTPEARRGQFATSGRGQAANKDIKTNWKYETPVWTRTTGETFREASQSEEDKAAAYKQVLQFALKMYDDRQMNRQMKKSLLKSVVTADGDKTRGVVAEEHIQTRATVTALTVKVEELTAVVSAKNAKKEKDPLKEKKKAVDDKLAEAIKKPWPRGRIAGLLVKFVKDLNVDDVTPEIAASLQRVPFFISKILNNLKDEEYVQKPLAEVLATLLKMTDEMARAHDDKLEKKNMSKKKKTDKTDAKKVDKKADKKAGKKADKKRARSPSEEDEEVPESRTPNKTGRLSGDRTPRGRDAEEQSPVREEGSPPRHEAEEQDPVRERGSPSRNETEEQDPVRERGSSSRHEAEEQEPVREECSPPKSRQDHEGRRRECSPPKGRQDYDDRRERSPRRDYEERRPVREELPKARHEEEAQRYPKKTSHNFCERRDDDPRRDDRDKKMRYREYSPERRNDRRDRSEGRSPKKTPGAKAPRVLKMPSPMPSPSHREGRREFDHVGGGVTIDVA
jgi:hypothetical protein